MQKISILGYGKMAKAIALGLNNKFTLEIMGRNKAKMEAFVRENNLQNATICADSRIDLENKIAILALKPHAFSAFQFHGNAKAIISIMAGITIQSLKNTLNAEFFIRTMPNLASLVGKGVSVIYIDSREVAQDSRDLCESKSLAQSIFAPLGECIFVDKEALIDPATAISGSGGAYLALIAEAMIDASVREGLSQEVSKELVRGLFSGFSALFATTEANSIRSDTTSPAGTTAEALAVLESRGVRSAFIEAIRAAHKKARILGRKKRG